MIGPTFHVSFDLIGAVILLGMALLAVVGLALLTSWHWKRQPVRASDFVAAIAPIQSLEQLLYALPVGLWLMDRHGHVHWRNQDAERLVSLDHVSASLEARLIAIVERMVEGRDPVLHEVQYTPDAQFQIKALFLAGQDGTTADRIACIVVDIPDSQHREEFYRHFIANVSHELLTPFAAIKGHVANIRASGEAEIAIRKTSLATIEREVDRLFALTGDLLRLSHLESEIPLNFKLTNVNVVAEEAVSDLLGLARQKQIELVVQLEPRLPRIQADGDQLQRVFLNLVDNAIKYCLAGSRVQVQLQADGRDVVARVADNGPGIPAGDLPHIFEKFYQVQNDGTRSRQGSGLGLAIVKRIVELHNGMLTVDSLVGKGTTFTLRLPIGPQDAAG